LLQILHVCTIERPMSHSDAAFRQGILTVAVADNVYRGACSYVIPLSLTCDVLAIAKSFVLTSCFFWQYTG